ncbi:MAG: tRNA (guanosine(37)-N1)-methyltransferase TrmD [Tissierellia bacterium]|nr:tRNA (guanosine(37)-N1)-methyltransferase TrmD [Tissierellia bacterium]
MKVTILTLFPDSFRYLKEYGIIGKAINKGLIELEVVNIRDYSKNKHKKVDDTVYGGKAGMLMTCQPIYDCLMDVKNKNSKVIYLSAQGSLLDQKKVVDLSKYEHLVLLCGHYEGIDARIVKHYVDYEISIGDYVLTGGEIPAMVLLDSVSRFVDKVVGNHDSLITDSHYNGLLQYDEYTKPRVFNGYMVPNELLSGDPKKIDKWNLKNSLNKTKKIRKDLYDKYIEAEVSDGFIKKDSK